MKLYNSIFYSIIAILSIIFILHYRDFSKINNNFEVLNINYKLSNYNRYTKENLPIIFNKMIDINDIISPITIKKYNIENLDYKDSIYHTNNLLFIFVNDNITINISLPNECSKFKLLKKKNTIKLLKNIDKNYKYIQLNLNKNNILSIPRFWIFKILTLNPNINIYSYDTLFTRVFNIFY
jgi:hypothetical protein